MLWTASSRYRLARSAVSPAHERGPLTPEGPARSAARSVEVGLAWGGSALSVLGDRVDECGDLVECRRVALEVREVRDAVEEASMSGYGAPRMAAPMSTSPA